MLSRSRTRAVLAAAATFTAMLMLPPVVASAEVSDSFDVFGDVADVESDPDGRLLVLTHQTHDSPVLNGALQVYDADHQRLAAVELGLRPTAMAYDATRDRAYVIGYAYTSEGRLQHSLTAVDVATGTVASSIPVDGWAFEVAADAISGKVFVTNLGDYYAEPRVAPHLLVLNSDLSVAARVVGSEPTYLAVAPGGESVYVNDQRQVTVHRASAGYVGEPVATVAGATRMTLSADAGTLYVGSQTSRIAVIKTATGVRTESSDLGGGVLDIAVNNGGTRLLVAQPWDHKVSVVDALTLERVGVVLPGGDPLALHHSTATDITYARDSEHSRWLGRIMPSAPLESRPTVSAVASTIVEGNPSMVGFCDDREFSSYCYEDKNVSRQVSMALNAPSTEATEVAYRLGSPGSASDGQDYYAYSGRVLIPAGTTTGVANLTVLADKESELDETLTLEITSALGADVDPASATAKITIADDDASTGTAPADSAPPTIDISSPVSATNYTYEQVVTASWSCTDASAIAACGAAVNGTPIAWGEPLNTTAVGTHTFTVTAQDQYGNSTSRDIVFTVLPAGDLATTVDADGGTVTTGTTATVNAPLQTSITVPAGTDTSTTSSLTVTTQSTTTTTAGFNLFGQTLVIEGPVASVQAPYEMSFTVDETALNGIAPSDVQVFRNGVAMGACTDAVAAIPDPCVVYRGLTPSQDDGGDALVTVRTSHFSTWTLGGYDYDLSGPFKPIKPDGSNTAKAGSTIPVKFELGGNKGLDVFTDGYPKLARCSGAPLSIRSGSALEYDAKSATYTYKWRTDRAAKGCTVLTLRFRDGSEFTARFALR